MPAVIVAVTNGDKILVTRYKGRPYRGYALIAGFCEIGETGEETVAREVFEEAGVKVKNIRYYTTQPWGIAQDLLLGAPSEVTNQQLEDVHLLGSTSALAQRSASSGAKQSQGNKRSTFSNAQQLNQLSLSEEEEALVQGIFSKMNEKEQMLKNINTENVEEMVHVMPMTNILREDVREQKFSRESLLEGAPERSEDSWQVPRLVK